MVHNIKNQGVTILIADSSMNSINRLARFLKAEGFTILIAIDQKQTLAISANKKPDILIIDTSVCISDFSTLTKNLKLQNSDAIIFLMTENGRDEKSNEAINNGAEEFISKTSPPFELLTRIRHSLKRKNSTKSNSEKFKENEFSVLLVEDNELNQEYAGAIIEGMGLKVYLAADGLTALELLKNSSFDVVVTDINVPLMNGLELCKTFRQLPNGGTPILAVSGHAENTFGGKLKESGINKYLMKPYSAKQLKDALGELLSITQIMEVQTETEPETLSGDKKYSYKEALKVAKGDQALFASWLSRFKEVLFNASEGVEQALENNSYEKKTKIFHELLNYAGYFGINKLSTYIQELNSVAQLTESEENIRNFYLKIKAELESVVRFYKQVE